MMRSGLAMLDARFESSPVRPTHPVQHIALGCSEMQTPTQAKQRHQHRCCGSTRIAISIQRVSYTIPGPQHACTFAAQLSAVRMRCKMESTRWVKMSTGFKLSSLTRPLSVLCMCCWRRMAGCWFRSSLCIARHTRAAKRSFARKASFQLLQLACHLLHRFVLSSKPLPKLGDRSPLRCVDLAPHRAPRQAWDGAPQRVKNGLLVVWR
jgi:hypothetical protein